MQFDSTTTLIAACCIITVLGAQLLFFWGRDRRSPWLAWYAAAFIEGALAAALYALPPNGHEFLLFGLGNSLRILTFVFLWHGARTFAGRRPEQLVGVLSVALWLALCSISGFLASLQWRVIVSSFCIALFCGLAAFELWRVRRERLPSLYPAIIACSSYAVVGAARIPLANVLPFPAGALPMDPTWLAGSAFVTFIHAVFIAAFTISMTRERHELQQRRFALLDPLTGLFNRRAFIDQLGYSQHHRSEDHQLFAMLMLDLDHFKLINDQFGHDAGDRMLQHFADIARGAIPPGDHLFRMGGEEFCAVLRNMTVQQARGVAEKLRHRLLRHHHGSRHGASCTTPKIALSGLALSQIGGRATRSRFCRWRGRGPRDRRGTGPARLALAANLTARGAFSTESPEAEPTA